MVGSSSNLAMNLDKGGYMIMATWTWRCNYLYVPLQQRVRLQTPRHQQAVVVQHLQYNAVQYRTYSTVQVIQHLPGHEVSEGEAVPRKPAATVTPQEADTQMAYHVWRCVLS